MKKAIALFCFFLLLTLSTAFAADSSPPLRSEAEPNIMGLQLGNPMKWQEMMATEKNLHRTLIEKKTLPQRLPGGGVYSVANIHPISYTLTIANNYSVLTQKDLSKKRGKWVHIRNLDGILEITGTGGMGAQVPKRGSWTRCSPY